MPTAPPGTPAPTGWSVRALAPAAGVTYATARAAVRDRVIDPMRLSAIDVPVLAVYSATSTWTPPGIQRPANATRTATPGQAEAIRRTRVIATEIAAGSRTHEPAAMLFVHAETAQYCATTVELITAAAGAAAAGTAFLVLPIGPWLARLARLTPRPSDTP